MVSAKLLDRYVLEDRLASGGMGTVWAATDERLGRRVAVKELKEDLASDPRFVERFRREARAVAALSHPNIANVFDYGEDDGRHFIVMELIEGRDLSRILREDGPLDPNRSIHIAIQMLDALGHAHSAGVIHRDVKAANVIVTEDERVKVTDFGIARAVGDSTLTATGSVLGTAHYISPEQASGDRITPSSDLYAAGIVLYEMLTGSLPFTGDSPIAVAMRHVSDDIPAPSERNPDVPRELDAVVARAVQKRPADRFGDAGEMRAALAALTGEAGSPTTAVMGAGGAAPTERLGPAGTEELDGTVWPIPGTRWDPYRIGRGVLIAFAALAVIAAALVLARLAGRETPQSERRAGGGAPVESPTPTPSPEPGESMPSLIGDNKDEAKSVLEGLGLELDIKDEKVENDAPKDTVIDTDPGPGEPLEFGDTVTLFLSEGPEEDDDDDDGPGRSGDRPPPGKGKKDD
ncbi:MAG: protein kinase domain-containing protein [Actinomycetota bacterium]